MKIRYNNTDMKISNYFLAIFLALTFKCAKAQVVKYQVLNENTNYYDKDMQSFTGWKDWVKTYVGGELSWGIVNFSFSQNAARYEYYFTIFSRKGSEDYENRTTIVYTFTNDEPTEEFPFRKKVAIKTVASLKNPSRPQANYNTETTGTGYIYSANTYQSILSGNSTAAIYVYFEMSDGFKGYVGRMINKNTQARLDEIQEEKEQAAADAEEAIEEAKREKQERTNQNIKAIGNAIQLLTKKKN